MGCSLHKWEGDNGLSKARKPRKHGLGTFFGGRGREMKGKHCFPVLCPLRFSDLKAALQHVKQLINSISSSQNFLFHGSLKQPNDTKDTTFSLLSEISVLASNKTRDSINFHLGRTAGSQSSALWGRRFGAGLNFVQCLAHDKVSIIIC